jgi:hypothetical protein
MPNFNGLLPVAFLLALPLSASAQDAPDPHVDENPFRNEQPKPDPPPRVAPAAALRVAEVGRPATTEIRFAGDAMPITIELPGQPAPGVQGEEEDAPPPVARPLNLRDSVVARENFDRWAFGVGTERERLHKLDRLLFRTVENVAWQNTMTGRERAKLTLAGRGDVKRLLDRIEAERPEFEEARMNLATGRQAILRLKPLSVEVEKGPFGDDSLFAKTLRKILREKAESKGR